MSAFSKPHENQKNQGNLIQRSVAWFHAADNSTGTKLFRKVIAVVVSVFLLMSLVGIPLIVLGAKEWKIQEQKWNAKKAIIGKKFFETTCLLGGIFINNLKDVLFPSHSSSCSIAVLRNYFQNHFQGKTLKELHASVYPPNL